MSKDKIFDELTEEDKIVVEENDDTIVEAPSIHDPEWNDYVLSLFDPKELLDADTDKPKPLVAGLRRVSEMLLGQIIKSGPTQVFPSTDADHPGKVTVIFTVVFENGIEYSEVADSWSGNTDDEFIVYNTATASTRAEARALRKALKLRTVAAEEITSKDTSTIGKAAAQRGQKADDGEFKEDGPMTAKQDKFINTLCDRAGINREKMLAEVFSVKDDNLPKKLASDVIDALNSYNNGNKEIPESIKN